MTCFFSHNILLMQGTVVIKVLFMYAMDCMDTEILYKLESGKIRGGQIEQDYFHIRESKLNVLGLPIVSFLKSGWRGFRT